MENYQKVAPDQYRYIMDILNQNSNKSFVQRILRPQDFPRLDLGQGNYATHKMAWGQVGDKHIVYPTVLLDTDGQLKDFGREALDHVLQTGNYIEFPNRNAADWFSQNYKGAWGGKMNNEPE